LHARPVPARFERGRFEVADHIVLGKLESDPFESCWNGPRMQELRRTHFERTPSPMCARCRRYWVGHP